MFDLGDLGECRQIRSVMYDGALPLRAFKVSNGVLNWALSWTGNQRRDPTLGWYPTVFLVPLNSLAATFCTDCRQETQLKGPAIIKSWYSGYTINLFKDRIWDGLYRMIAAVLWEQRRFDFRNKVRDDSKIFCIYFYKWGEGTNILAIIHRMTIYKHIQNNGVTYSDILHS